jgi:hypothetical protein
VCVVVGDFTTFADAYVKQAEERIKQEKLRAIQAEKASVVEEQTQQQQQFSAEELAARAEAEATQLAADERDRAERRRVEREQAALAAASVAPHLDDQDGDNVAVAAAPAVAETTTASKPAPTTTTTTTTTQKQQQAPITTPSNFNRPQLDSASKPHATAPPRNRHNNANLALLKQLEAADDDDDAVSLTELRARQAAAEAEKWAALESMNAKIKVCFFEILPLPF